MMNRATIQFPDLAYFGEMSLAEVGSEAASLTAQAQAFVSEVHRARRAAIRAAVDKTGAPGRRRERVETVAAELGISVTQVYQAIRADAAEPKPPKTLMEALKSWE